MIQPRIGQEFYFIKDDGGVVEVVVLERHGSKVFVEHANCVCEWTTTDRLSTDYPSRKEATP